MGGARTARLNSMAYAGSDMTLAVGAVPRVTAGMVARPVRPLSPEDSLGRAAEALRTTGLEGLPVVAFGRCVGWVTAADVFDTLRHNLEAGRMEPVLSCLRPQAPEAPPDLGLEPAVERMDLLGTQTLVITEPDGKYRGLVTRGDLVSAWCGAVRPARIGGMATPVGVYLTAGTIQAGAGNLGLTLTGVAMGLTIGLCIVLLERWPWAIALPAGLQSLIPLVAVVGMLRLSALAGYHAAEHQTVWAIEEGEPLEPSIVCRMPRPHPRCGTNLTVAMFGFFLLFSWIYQMEQDPTIAALAGILGAVMAWKYLGRPAQQYLTTKPATPRQLRSGIGAGKELLAKYAASLGTARPTPLWRRIWNMGLVQVLLGVTLASVLVQLVFMKRVLVWL